MSEASIDDLFENKIKKNFEFDESVARVFDDMLVRSIPFYKEILRLCVQSCIKNTKADDRVYDIGCSTANLLIDIKTKHPKLKLIGIDSSEPMINIASQKIKAYNYDIDLICKDVFDTDLYNAQMIYSNYTFQFIRPLLREKLLKKIYDGLNTGGIFICSEKLISEDKILNKQLLDEYFSFKQKNGYNETQIMQKREALENVLIPFSMSENILLLEQVGFKHIDVIFRWANFATFFGRK